MSAINKEITKACQVLQQGGLILYPTDTIWGIGCDATDTQAVKKVYQLKGRRESKSMIILLDHTDNLTKYVKNVPDKAYELIENATVPLTIIYPQAQNLAKDLINKDGSIGIRVTKDIFCKELIMKFGKPIVSTSANISEEDYPKFFFRNTECYFEWSRSYSKFETE